MVRCTKCGVENKEDARFCIQCGASLIPARVRHEKSDYDICYGPVHAVRFFWLFLGTILLLWGITEVLGILFNVSLNIWPFLIIVVGLYIIYRVLSRPRRL